MLNPVKATRLLEEEKLVYPKPLPWLASPREADITSKLALVDKEEPNTLQADVELLARQWKIQARYVIYHQHI